MTKRIWIKSGVAIVLYLIFQFGNPGWTDFGLITGFWATGLFFLFHYYSCKRVEKHNEAIRHCSYALANCSNILLILSGMISVHMGDVEHSWMFFTLIEDPPIEFFFFSLHLIMAVIVLDLMLWILPITGLCRSRR